MGTPVPGTEVLTAGPRATLRPVPPVPLRAAAVVVCALALLGAAFAWNNLRGGSAAATAGDTSGVIGAQIDRPAPAMTLVSEHGTPVSTRSWRGKVVVIAPILTLCNEVCPITTGAFNSLAQTLRRDGLAGRVLLAEVTVDPWRDSPARLRAYSHLVGAQFPLFTGSQAQIRAFWRFFGVFYKRVPEGHPAQIDWWTHRRLTFDVAHTDGLLFVDATGHWRIALTGMPNTGGRLEARLRRLLSNAGLSNLAHPEQAWTTTQVLRDIRVLLQS